MLQCISLFFQKQAFATFMILFNIVMRLTLSKRGRTKLKNAIFLKTIEEAKVQLDKSQNKLPPDRFLEYVTEGIPKDKLDSFLSVEYNRNFLKRKYIQTLLQNARGISKCTYAIRLCSDMNGKYLDPDLKQTAVKILTDLQEFLRETIDWELKI